MKKTILKNVYLLPMDQKNPSANSTQQRGNIVISGDRIEAITYDLASIEQERGEVIDGSGMLALPGLVNCHTHASMSLLRSYADDLPLMQWLENEIWPMEAKLKPAYVYWGAQLAILEMIKGGTTCFADMYFMMDAVAQVVEESGIRACLSRGLIALNEGEKALAENVAFVEKYHKSAQGRITTMFGPHAPYTCDPAFLKLVFEEAKRLGVGIHTHLAETLHEVEQIRSTYNKSPIELVYDTGLFSIQPFIAAHCVHLTDRDIDLLADANIGIAHNPESNMKLASGIAPIKKMMDKSMKVGIGTDGAASNNNLDMFQEMRSASLLQKVHTMDPTAISAHSALYMGTKGGAEVLGIGEDVGILAPGKKADLILLDLNAPHLQPLNDLTAHVVYSASASDVTTVFINGELLMHNREMKTMDAERIFFECNQIIKKMTVSNYL